MLSAQSKSVQLCLYMSENVPADYSLNQRHLHKLELVDVEGALSYPCSCRVGKRTLSAKEPALGLPGKLGPWKTPLPGRPAEPELPSPSGRYCSGDLNLRLVNAEPHCQ